MTARDPLPGSYAQPLLPQLRPTAQQVWERKVVAQRIARDSGELRRKLAACARANGWGRFPNKQTGRLEWRRITEREALLYKRSRVGALSPNESKRLGELQAGGVA